MTRPILTLRTVNPWNPQAVVFDMDGLLLNTEVLARRALRVAGTGLGMELPDALCEAMTGVPVDICHQLLLRYFGEDCATDTLIAGAARVMQAQIAGGKLHRMPGVGELLTHLQMRKIPRAVATSSSREKALHHLTAAGLVDCFDTIVTRSDVAQGKPHPDLYVEAATRLGLPPGRCLALEDSYNGVRAAHAAGMPVVMVPDLLQPTAEMQDICLAVAQDLHAVLARMQPAARQPAGVAIQHGRSHA